MIPNNLPFDPAALTKDDLIGVGIGVTSEVVHIRGTSVVAKLPANTLGSKPHETERRVYERLQNHPNILRYLGQSPTSCKLLRGALLFEYHPRGCLNRCLDQHKANHKRKDWPRQAASALAYLHSHSIIYSDFGLHNILLNVNDQIVLSDFAGSGIDDDPPIVAPSFQYSKPHPTPADGSVDRRDDTFALGSVLYELDQGHSLLEELEPKEIEQRFRDGQFPDLSKICRPLADVIHKCWNLPKYTAADALKELSNV